jgi:DNA-binding transcriptional MocR family regulator
MAIVVPGLTRLPVCAAMLGLWVAVSAPATAHAQVHAGVSAPRAGFLLWVELPRQVNALEVHRRALELGIGVSPGPLFSSRSDLPNYLRLNCANEPTPRLLGAVGQVGEICRGLLGERPGQK